MNSTTTTRFQELLEEWKSASIDEADYLLGTLSGYVLAVMHENPERGNILYDMLDEALGVRLQKDAPRVLVDEPGDPVR